MRYGERLWILCCVSAVGTVIAAAAQAHLPYLWHRVDVEDGVQAENGLTFEVFGQRSELALRFTYLNDETKDSLSVPSAFIESLDITWQLGNRAIPITVDWRSVDVVTGDQIKIPVSVGAPVVLEPGGKMVLHGVTRRVDGASFERGEHRLTVNKERAVKTLRSPTGDAWLGRYVGTGAVTIRVVEPTTPAEVRRMHLAEGSRALSGGDGATALAHFAELLRLNGSDLEAHAGAGQAYFKLGRLKEAAAEFERVLAQRRGTRSGMHLSLAYAYVALGENSKAEAVLIAEYGPDSAKRHLESITRAVQERSSGR